jgi:hypothetical protein
MSPNRVGAALVAAASLIAWAGSSRAEPPPPMWAGAFDVPVVACDTREQAVAIAKAGQESGQAMLARYQQLATTINGKGDPSCANSRISALIVDEREDLGLALRQRRPAAYLGRSRRRVARRILVHLC